MTASRSDESAPEAMSGRSVRGFSMATWLAVVVLAVTVSSLIVTAGVTALSGGGLADDLIDEGLGSRSAFRVDQVERYVDNMRRRAAAIASSPATAAAAMRFSEAYEELGTLDDQTAGSATGDVARFYREEFAPELEAILGAAIAWQDLVPTSDAALYLQQHYVIAPDVVAGDRRLVDDAGDGSAWSAAHAELHPRFLKITERFGIEDLALVDPATGAVVYSTAKMPDFATSLELGPYSGSTLASLVRDVRNAPERDTAAIADLASYVPLLGRPVGFLASPVYDADRLVGILVMQLPVDELNAIMTGDRSWEEEGLGATGETFLVGRDGRMRSDSRAFLENPAVYLATVEAQGTATQLERDAMAGTGTTAVFQKVADRGQVEAAESAPSEVIETSSYLGERVLSSYEPVAVDGLDWAVVAEIAKDEADEPVDDFRRVVVIAAALFVIFITFASVAWAARVFRPVRAISDALRRAHEGEDVGHVGAFDGAPRDFTDLAHHIDSMLDALKGRRAALAVAAEQRLDTVRSLLPAAVAQRIEAGEGDLLDQIPQAAIVVLVAEGLGALVESHDPSSGRELVDRIVTELDELAGHHGLDRVKVVGDAYVAGCGLSHSYLDHVPRTIGFALAARDLFRELREQTSAGLGSASGIHTGPVTVGLSGSARFVYDLWGEAVDVADVLARTAQPGQILVSDEVRALLPDDIEARRQSDPSAMMQIWEVVGQRSEQAGPS